MAKSDRSKRIATRKKQIVYSEKRYILKERYLSPKGKLLLVSAKTKAEKKAVWDKYGKNRYMLNPKARPVNVIIHYVM